MWGCGRILLYVCVLGRGAAIVGRNLVGLLLFHIMMIYDSGIRHSDCRTDLMLAFHLKSYRGRPWRGMA